MSSENQISFPVTGSCQCKQVQYSVQQAPSVTVVCHCIDCQKLSAGAFSMTMIMSRENLQITTGELEVFDRPAASGNTARCYFCKVCGNRIYHENPDKPGMIRLKPGTLDNTDVIKPDMHVWTSSAQKWVRLPDDLPCHETQPDITELFAQGTK